MTLSTSTAAPAAKREQPPQPQRQLHRRRPRAGGCAGEGCAARDPWPLHHVRHRGDLCRLCTSCVLRCHPGSFCFTCFDLLDGRDAGGGASQRHAPAVVHCARCPSVCHAACLPDFEEDADYVCPSCANPSGFSYFPVGRGCDVDDAPGSPRKKVRVADGDGGEEKPQVDGQRRRLIDWKSAKALLSAAQLASASMKRAVAFARSEAERKAKDSVSARKKAKEMLEKALMAAKREGGKRRQDMLLQELQRKTAVKLDGAMVARKKHAQKAERERYMKLYDPNPLAQKTPAQAIVDNDRLKGSFSSPLKPSYALNPGPQNSVKLDEGGKNVTVPDSESSFTSEKERGAAKVPVKCREGVRVPPSKQDASVTNSNPRTTLPSPVSLHS